MGRWGPESPFSLQNIEELTEWSITGRVQWESEGKMVHKRLCGWVGSKLMDSSIKNQMMIK